MTWACSRRGGGRGKGKRRRKKEGEEEEGEKEEGRGREGEEGGGRGRKEWEEIHYPGKREHPHTPVLGKWRVLWVHSLCPYQGTELYGYLPQAAAAVLGEPFCLLPPERGTTCPILQEHKCPSSLGIQGNMRVGP